MKILISTDIEGVAGVVDPEQTRAGNAEYEQARRWMAEEANAAIAGAFEGGASVVYVNDSHAGFRNMRAGDIDKRAVLISGKPRPYAMMGGLELGGACGGFVIGLIGWLGYPVGLNSVFGPSGLLALPLMTSEHGSFFGMGVYLTGMVSAWIGGFIITWFFGSKDVDLS